MAAAIILEVCLAGRLVYQAALGFRGLGVRGLGFRV